MAPLPLIDWTTIIICISCSFCASYFAIGQRVARMEARLDALGDAVRESNRIANEACEQLREHVRDCMYRNQGGRNPPPRSA
jgi:hypothetical protein